MSFRFSVAVCNVHSTTSDIISTSFHLQWKIIPTSFRLQWNHLCSQFYQQQLYLFQECKFHECKLCTIVVILYQQWNAPNQTEKRNLLLRNPNTNFTMFIFFPKLIINKHQYFNIVYEQTTNKTTLITLSQNRNLKSKFGYIFSKRLSS